MKRKNKAQSFLEYSVLIVIVAIALLCMKLYFGRAVQEKYRQSADVFGEGEQYATGITESIDVTKGNIPAILEQADAKDACVNILARIDIIKNEISELLDTAAKFEAEAVKLDAQVAILNQKNMSQQAMPLIESAHTLREKATFLKDKAQVKQDQISNLQEIKPECFK